jgi:hypothetical protein
MDGFPGRRSRKNNLISDFIEAALVLRKEPGSRTSASDSNKPEFASAFRRKHLRKGCATK